MGTNTSSLYQSISKDPAHHQKEIKALYKKYDKNKNQKLDGDEVNHFIQDLLEYLKSFSGDSDPELEIDELKKRDSLSYDEFKRLLEIYLKPTHIRHTKRKDAKPKEYRDMVNAFVGTWEGSSAGPDVLAISSLPHNTFHIIKDFLLCTHANLNEVLVIDKPIEWTDANGIEFLSCEYQQTITDTKKELVHEEVGMFLFNLQDGTVSRHGVIPHGSTFVMKGSLLWEEGHTPKIPSTPTIPLANPNFSRPIKGAIISNTYTAGLERDVVFENTNVPISDPAILLQEYNEDKHFKNIQVFDFPETKTLDLEFVNDFSKDKKLIHSANSTFWIFEDSADKLYMQYIQTINFDFPTNVPLIQKGDFQVKDNIRWPHITCAKLTKKN